LGHFAALRSLGGDQGAREILNGPQGTVDPIDFPELGVDLDTMADYEAWKKDPGRGA
jgi:CTP:molybdopterin cytidylyltransferase MocA